MPSALQAASADKYDGRKISRILCSLNVEDIPSRPQKPNPKIDSKTPCLLSGMCEARLAKMTSAAQTPTILGGPPKSLPLFPCSASDNCATK